MRRRVEVGQEAECGVWPENLEAVEVFLGCQTQWRIAFGGATGLDYTAVATVMDLHAVEDRRDCFERVRTLEAEALTVIAKQSD